MSIHFPLIHNYKYLIFVIKMMIQHDAIKWFTDLSSIRNFKNVTVKSLPLRESRWEGGQSWSIVRNHHCYQKSLTWLYAHNTSAYIFPDSMKCMQLLFTALPRTWNRDVNRLMWCTRCNHRSLLNMIRNNNNFTWRLERSMWEKVIFGLETDERMYFLCTFYRRG